MTGDVTLTLPISSKTMTTIKSPADTITKITAIETSLETNFTSDNSSLKEYKCLNQKSQA